MLYVVYAGNEQIGNCLHRLITTLLLQHMVLLQRLLGILAPHTCLGCGIEGSLICDFCRDSSLPEAPSACGFCLKIAFLGETCEPCRKHFPIYHVWAVTLYEGIAKELVIYTKFEAARAGCKIIAQMLAEHLPVGVDFTVIVPVPTISPHIRVRGFDHAAEIAKQLSIITKVPMVPYVKRIDQTTQLGSSRKDRIGNLKNKMYSANTKYIKYERVLLVDDVITTGASLSETARVLKRAGVKVVDAVVFARA